jgi:hypothetical protein
MSPDNSVGIETGYEFDSRQRQGFSLSATSRPALGPTQPPIQWVPGALSPAVKRQEREAYHSTPPSAEVKIGGAIPPLTPPGAQKIKIYMYTEGPQKMYIHFNGGYTYGHNHKVEPKCNIQCVV